MLIVKHRQQVQLSRKTDLIKICLNVILSGVSAEPSGIFFLNTGRFQTNVLQPKKKQTKKNKQTRAHPSLRDSTCPNPKSSNPSRSIPHLLLLCAALGVLATPHLLSQTQRGGLKTTPLEDESYRLRWLSRTAQHLNAVSLCPHISPCFATFI